LDCERRNTIEAWRAGGRLTRDAKSAGRSTTEGGVHCRAVFNSYESKNFRIEIKFNLGNDVGYY
jgi:hypothetical protein